MTYYLQHPEHGIHICYTPEDVEAHKKLGWVPKEDAKPQPEVQKKKPGRKPKQ